MFILIVDEDTSSASLAQHTLKEAGYEVHTLKDPYEAMRVIRHKEPDLLITEINLPKINGLAFVTKLRAEGFAIASIFLTSRTGIEEKIQGFHAGADDYICKPYSHQELVARVQAVLRRMKEKEHNKEEVRMKGRRSQKLQCINMEFFPRLSTVVTRGEEIILSPTEAQVLYILMQRSGQIVERKFILQEVWNDSTCETNPLEVCIHRLRAKIELNPDKPRYIVTVRSIGYKFVDGGNI